MQMNIKQRVHPCSEAFGGLGFRADGGAERAGDGEMAGRGWREGLGARAGRWKHFYAEEKLLMATPEQGQGAGSRRGVLPTCSGAPVILGFYEWDGQRRREKD